MKKLSVFSIIGVFFIAVFFDDIIVFLLSGTIPALNVTIPATTMLAIMIASIVLIIALKSRRAIYQNCLEMYDELFDSKKKLSAPHQEQVQTLPRRRYQEL